MITDTVIVNLLEKSVCLVELHYNESSCENGAEPVVSEEVQQRAATLVMARSMIEAFVPSLLSLFIGPWSDTNGRRPLILLSLACKKSFPYEYLLSLFLTFYFFCLSVNTNI